MRLWSRALVAGRAVPATVAVGPSARHIAKCAEPAYVVSRYLRPLPPYEPKATRRCGVVGYKHGIATMWDAWGVQFAATVVRISGVRVLEARAPQFRGDQNVTVGTGTRSMRRASPKVRDLCANVSKVAGAPEGENDAPAKISSFHVTPDAMPAIGQTIGTAHFNVGGHVDVGAYSRGQGFCGVMKRWKFRGQPASHGVTKAHRKRGATGGRQDPGKVWPGTKMAGRMGHDYRRVLNLRVMRVDHDDGILYLRGPVPGPVGTYIDISDSLVHRATPAGPVPSAPPRDGIEVLGLEPGEVDPYARTRYERTSGVSVKSKTAASKGSSAAKKKS